MSKFWSLFINENIKTFKKKSTIIVILISILSLFGAVGITKLAKFEEEYFETGYASDWKTYLNEEMQSVKNDLNSNLSNYSKQTIADLKSQVDGMQFALDNDINYQEEYNYWKSVLLQDIISKRHQLYLAEDGSSEYEKIQEEINNLEGIIKNDDYNEYIQAQFKKLKNEYDNKEITEEEYKIQEEILNLKRKYEIGKTLENKDKWKQDTIEELEAIKETKRTKVDTNTGKTLDYKQYEELEEKEKITLYRLENNIPLISSNSMNISNYRDFYNSIASGFATFFIGILIIMIAGSSISTEISKGTIKFWMMTPNKRWKILLSKILSAIFIMLITTIILSLLSFAIGEIFFAENANPYLYVSNGEVQFISPIIYQVLTYLSYDIDIFVYAIFATMLSVLSRSSALSIGITIALYSGANAVMQIVNMLVKSDWIKFIPFNNMGLTTKIFKNAMTYSDMQIANEFLNNVNLGFSLVVLAVCVVLMLVTMFDSFSKKDIT